MDTELKDPARRQAIKTIVAGGVATLGAILATPHPNPETLANGDSPYEQLLRDGGWEDMRSIGGILTAAIFPSPRSMETPKETIDGDQISWVTLSPTFNQPPTGSETARQRGIYPVSLVVAGESPVPEGNEVFNIQITGDMRAASGHGLLMDDFAQQEQVQSPFIITRSLEAGYTKTPTVTTYSFLFPYKNQGGLGEGFLPQDMQFALARTQKKDGISPPRYYLVIFGDKNHNKIDPRPSSYFIIPLPNAPESTQSATYVIRLEHDHKDPHNIRSVLESFPQQEGGLESSEAFMVPRLQIK